MLVTGGFTFQLDDPKKRPVGNEVEVNPYSCLGSILWRHGAPLHDLGAESYTRCKPTTI